MRLSAVLLLLVILAPIARADDKQVARDAYRDGTRLFDLADYKAALEAFKRAYFNYEDPAFLYNIGQCYNKLNQPGDALHFYQTYLRKAPNAFNADVARRQVATLEAEIERARSAAPPSHAPEPVPAAPPPTTATPATVTPTPARPPAASVTAELTRTPPPVTPRRPAYRKWWVWTLVGVAAAAAATAVAVGVTEGQRTEPLFSTVHAQ